MEKLSLVSCLLLCLSLWLPGTGRWRQTQGSCCPPQANLQGSLLTLSPCGLQSGRTSSLTTSLSTPLALRMKMKTLKKDQKVRVS